MSVCKNPGEGARVHVETEPQFTFEGCLLAAAEADRCRWSDPESSLLDVGSDAQAGLELCRSGDLAPVRLGYSPRPSCHSCRQLRPASCLRPRVCWPRLRDGRDCPPLWLCRSNSRRIRGLHSTRQHSPYCSG